MVKPSRCRNSQKRIIEDIADRMAPSIGWRPGEAGVDLVPVGDPLLAQPPAEEDRPVVPQRVEVHQPRLEALEHAADRLELLEVAVDPLGVAR